MSFCLFKPVMAEASGENDSRRKSRRSKFLEASQPGEVTRRVLAPFLARHRKRSMKLRDVKEEFRQVYQQSKPGEVLAQLAEYFRDKTKLEPVLIETSEIIKIFTKSDGMSLYLVDPSNEYIVLEERYAPGNNRHMVRYPIEPGTTVAAYVAFVQEFVAVEDILRDPRFPLGIPEAGKTVKSVLCIPVLTSNGRDVLAVIELYRDIYNEPYSMEEQQTAVTLAAWMGAAIHQNDEKLFVRKENDLTKYLLKLLQLFFSRVIPFDKFVSDIIVFAKTTVGAERGFFYLMVNRVVEGTEEDIVTEVYEEGLDASPLAYKKKATQRFTKNSTGIAGYVARTGKSVIIDDAYQDPRFNRENDILGYRSRSIVAVPIKSSLYVFGVLKLVNKFPNFTEKDEEILKIFASFSLLASQFEKTSEDLRITLRRNEGYRELALLQLKPPAEEKQLLAKTPLMKTSEMPKGYFSFGWFLGGHEYSSLHYVLFSITSCVGSEYFDHSSLSEFVIMVKKSYRPNPYHNFVHAFTVFHCMFNIIDKNRQKFSILEKAALLIASLCHDADHFGYTNSFLVMTDNWLADLYEQSTLEHHHIDICMMLIQITDLFSMLTQEEWYKMKDLIESLILATDLALHFKIRGFISNMSKTGAFDWTNYEHRLTLMHVMMTTCDISGQCKPFPVAKYVTECLYTEFYNQGDEEKKRGLIPLSMMDREQMDLIPIDQIQFLSIICIPCVEILVSLLPNTEPLLKLCLNVRESWRIIKEQQEDDLWWPEESLYFGTRPFSDAIQDGKFGFDISKSMRKILINSH